MLVLLFRRLLLVVLTLVAGPSTAAAHGVIRGFVDEVVASGLTVPVAFATLPDGRILVAEKPGVVRVVRNGQVLPDAFLDLRDQVNDYWDRGLLGIVADPAFDQNGYIYLFYVVETDPFLYSGPKTSRVVRVTAAGDLAVPGSETVLLDGIPADSPSHDGGALRFGPDGALWITTGDASSFNAVEPNALRSQQLDSLAGKLLRVGRDGRGLADNPFWTGNGHDVRSKVWAYGFRNPFRLTFRPATGRPYIADVGANLWEEVNAVGRGRNHGWPCVEGPAPQPGYEPLPECQALYAQGPAALEFPVLSYPHVGGSAAITGGAFVTAASFPAPYRDAYFFGDFVRGTLHHVSFDGADHAITPIMGFGSGIDGPVDVQADAAGLLYLSVTEGALHRVRAVPDTGARVTRYLSDAIELVTFASNGAGPVEIDRSHGSAAGGDGTTITIAGATYAKGLGVQAPSDLRFALGGACTSFSASVGVDDETKGLGSVTVQVWLDGALVVASGVVRGGAAPLSGTLDLTGRRELRLVVTDGGDGSSADHVDWADARVDCARAGGDALPPVVVATSPANGAGDVPSMATLAAEVSEDLDSATVGPSTVVLTTWPAGQPVPAAVSYDAATRSLRVQPSSPLSAGAGYRVWLAGGPGGIADVAGNTLASTYSWQFTVAGAVTNRSPLPVILAPSTAVRFRVGEVLAFTGTASDPEDGALPPSALRWAVSVRHCPGGICHTHPLTAFTGGSGSLTAPDHGADSYLRVTLTATDSGGRSASTSLDVLPRLVDVTLATEPPGLHVLFGESQALSPATFQAVVGSAVSIGTPVAQQSLSFVRWASGRPAQHVITVGEVDVVDTARFAAPPGVSYLSDLTWAAATNGAGPVERDRSHGDAAPGDGPPLTLRGVTYAKGLGVLAPADIRVRLNGACSRFTATVGLDDDVLGGGSVGVLVYTDGRVAAAHGPFGGVAVPLALSIDVTGVDELRLVVVDAGDGSVNDEVDWADARVTCAGPGAAPPAPPAEVRALGAGSPAGLWWRSSPGAVTYRLEAGSAPGLADLAVLDLPSNTLAATVPPGTYWVRVRAMNAWGLSPPSTEARLVVSGASGPPLPPTDLAATVTGHTVTLTWAPPVDGAWPTSYVVEATLNGGPFVPIVVVPGTSLVAGGVPAGTYVVRVRGLTDAGAGAASGELAVVVP